MAATPATSLTLVSSGVADERLQPPRGNPDLKQFVNVIHKTTRWAAQWSRVDFDGTAEFGQRVSVTLPQIGQLISGVTLAVTMPDIYAAQLQAIRAAGGTNFDLSGTFLGPVYGWTNSLGHALIQQIELEIGGAIVETLDGRLLEILDELYEPLDATIAKNAMICRAPHGFGPRTWLQPTPTRVHVPIPFWFSRRGRYSHALPIQALSADIVRIHITFRPLDQLVYTDARVDTRTVGYRAGVDTPGAMWGFTGGRFWRANPAATTRVYAMRASMDAAGVAGELIPDVRIPARMSPVDAHLLVEYIHLEDYEALTLRSAELTYHVEQHVALPVTPSRAQAELRIPLPYGNPTKDIMWVCQRPEAEQYNAWFLFTRDLTAGGGAATPWWPDAQLELSEAQDWQIRPGFQTSMSEPLAGAMIVYDAYERAVHEGGSFYRGMVPALHYTKSATINRYVYAYAFGARRTDGGGGPLGAANWDKIPRKEIYLTFAPLRGSRTFPELNVYMYVTQWNVFKVFGGRGGMLFST